MINNGYFNLNSCPGVAQVYKYKIRSSWFVTKMRNYFRFEGIYFKSNLNEQIKRSK